MFNLHQKTKNKFQKPTKDNNDIVIPTPKPAKIVKVKKPSQKLKFVGFTDGFGKHFSCVHIDTITAPKWKKNPNVYLVVLLKCNGKRTSLTLKWINECYCETISAYKIPDYVKLDMFQVRNWDIKTSTYVG